MIDTGGRLVPIASIVTPATLSVQSTAVAPAPVHAVDVPKLDFTNQAFAAPIPHGPQQNFADQIVTTATQQRGGFCFNGPSQAVSRVATAVAAEGQILSISAPGSNVSWILDFWAPSLRCADVETTERDGMFNHILDQWGNVSSCSHAFGYMAWPTEINRSVPLVQPHANSSTRVFEQDSMTYDAPASIYVATLPQMFNFAFLPAGNSDLQEKCRFYGRNSLVYSYPISDDVCLPGLQPPACYGQQAWLTDATLTRCDLLNATYRAVFEYRDGAQNITVTLGDSSSASPVIPQRCLNGTALHEDSAKLISYQGISAAFNDLVLGSITLDTGGAIPGPVFNSNVGNTVLMETEDLAFVVNFKGVNNTFDYLNTSRFPARENQRIGRRGSLKSALETLFQNITLSLLADEVLLANYSSPYAPADKSDVTFNLFHNVYIYSAPTLWGAYGVAIFLTLIALTLGFWSLLLNQGSFTNDFSTVLRTSWAGHLDEEVRIGDRDGRQPLPNYLSNARFWLGVDKSGSRLRSGGVELKEQPSAQTALLEVRREPV